MAKPVTYTVGGTVQAGGGIYIPRRADEELLKLCQEGTFAYVLTPRQMGKSSLMVRTAQTLAEEDVQAVIVDLQELGAQVTAEQWYFGFLVKLDDQLMFETDVVSWWREHENLGVSQRLTQFFEKVLLAEVRNRVVIFVDEIDSTLSLDFTDDFFTAIRYLYVARATHPEFHRLSFVLMGVATPGDLIRDAKRTPFNIGQRVDLTDFTFEEALPLADGLGLANDEAEQVLRWVLQWTGGHPYLTQRLCGAVLGRGGEGEKEVDKIVSSTFFGVMSEQDNNLQFVRDMLTKRAPHGLEKEVLLTYRNIRQGRRKVVDEEQSLVKSHLKLSGAVRREGNNLVVRNAIYRHVFDQRWIWEHFPENLWQRLKPALPLIATLSVFSISMMALAFYAFDRTREAEKQKGNAQLLAQNLTSENLSVSALNIEALTEGLRAEQTLRKLGKDAEADMQMRTVVTLQQLVYGQVGYAERNQLEGHGSSVTSVAFSPDGKTIASGSLDNTVKLWKLNGQEIKTLKGHGSSVTSVAFSRDGKTIATGSWDNTVKLWNLNGQEIKTLKGHGSIVTSVAFSPDGKTIATSSWDKTVKLWHLNGQEIKTLKGHGVAFSPDGKTIATGSEDNTVKLWNFDLDNLIILGCGWLEDYLISHPETLAELEQCQNQSRLLTAANTLVTKGERLAQEGDLKGAVAKFQQANKWNPKLKLNPEVKAAPAYVAQGLELAKDSDFAGAVAKFKQAQQLDPKIDLEPDTEGMQNHPELTAKKFVAPALIYQAEEHLKEGQFTQAVGVYTKIEKLQPPTETLAESWNSLCWEGSLRGYAKDVLFACEKAVSLAPKDGNILNSRGLARALTGDTKGAVEDFEAFIKWTDDDDSKKQRQAWVKDLRAGKQPFTPAVLQELRGE